MTSLKSSIGNRNHVSLDDACFLIVLESQKDELGQTTVLEKPYMVFCSKLSITGAEYNSAAQLGAKPELMLIVDSDTYENEKYLDYELKKYKIYKSFQRVDGFTELYCEPTLGKLS